MCKKLIYRHPHVFGDVSVSGTGEVLSNWEELKRKEKGQATNTDALESVARSLPALWRAEKVQKKAKKAGFDWPDVSGALDKLSEELEELKTAAAEGTNVAEELGDLLFSAVNVSRFLKVDCEDALNQATDKFIDRFRKMCIRDRSMIRRLTAPSPWRRVTVTVSPTLASFKVLIAFLLSHQNSVGHAPIQGDPTVFYLNDQISAQVTDYRDRLVHHEAQLCQVLSDLVLSCDFADGYRLTLVGHCQRHHAGLLSLLVSLTNQSGIK